MRLNEIREIPAVLQSQETFTLACFWTLLNLDLIQTWCDDRYCCTLYFDTIASQIDCDLHSRSQECGEAKTSVTIFLQSCEWIWMEFGMPLRLVGMSLDDLYFHSISQLYEKKMSIFFLSNLAVDVEEIQFVVTTCLFIQAYTVFILHK